MDELKGPAGFAPADGLHSERNFLALRRRARAAVAERAVALVG
jgi:hypothetical protein